MRYASAADRFNEKEETCWKCDARRTSTPGPRESETGRIRTVRTYGAHWAMVPFVMESYGGIGKEGSCLSRMELGCYQER
jgi:hypothetical protein